MDYEHMSWCNGKHEAIYGACELTRTIHGGLEVAIVGVPCSTVAVDLGGNLNDLDEAEMDAVLAQLSEFRSLLAASQGRSELLRARPLRRRLTSRARCGRTGLCRAWDSTPTPDHREGVGHA